MLDFILIPQELRRLGDLVIGGSELFGDLIQVGERKPDADGTEELRSLIFKALDSLLRLLLR